MTPRKKGGPHKPAQKQQSKASSAASGAPADAAMEPPRKRRRAWIVAGIIALVAIAAIVLMVSRRSAVGGAAQIASAFQSAPHNTADTDNVAFADFAGSESCAQCHADEYAKWQQSTHGHAGGIPGHVKIIAPFDGKAMHFTDAVVTPNTNARGEYTFTIAQTNRPVQTYRVEAVVGGGFLAGGGTQAFFTKFPDGTIRFVPFDFTKTGNRWFCNTLGRLNQGSVAITPAISLADCGDWTPTRMLGSHEGFETCQQCHGSQIDLTYDTIARNFQTRFTTLQINCESCHGPARKHIALAQSGRITSASDIGMRALATLDKEQSVKVCMQCHSVKSSLEPGYLPGRSLERHFALKFPSLLDPIYYPDGRTRVFAYQEGHLSSDCYLNGSMTCVDCHEPHSQKYRDTNGRDLPGRVDNGQCLSCHPSKAQPIERHTHHQATSAGSNCVSCHMPYLQQPNAGHDVRYARSDHTIPVPRPAFDSRMGVENPCAQCHRDKSPDALQASVDKWYGALKPHPASVAALVAADTLRDAQRAAQIILDSIDADHHPMAAFAGLANVMIRYTTPDMPELPKDITQKLERLAQNNDLDVKAVALATLHLASGNDRGVQKFLIKQAGNLGAQSDLVKSRWVLALRMQGDRYILAGQAQPALTTYDKGLEVDPNNAALLMSSGIAHARMSDFAAAIGQLRRSVSLDRRQPQAWLQLGLAYSQQGDASDAIQAFRDGIVANPWDGPLYANLGVAYFKAGDTQSAITNLERAVSLQPTLADAQFVLANAYSNAGRFRDAAAALERGLEFDPKNSQARRMLDVMRQNANKSGG
jgi:tetratricopeptide (TPR) repeat protein